MRTGIVGVLLLLVCFFTLAGATMANAGWESGLRLGYDSNIDRSLTDEISDSYASGYLSLSREPTGESRLDWFVTTLVGGTLYTKEKDLNYGEITVVPGVLYVPHRLVSVTLAPSVQVKGAQDSDRNAVSFGGKITVREQVSKDFYLSQYYLYENNEASADTYSFEQNAVGFSAGITWTPRFFSELVYEYSGSDAYRIVSPKNGRGHGEGDDGGRGKGGRKRTSFSSTEPVDRHSIGVSLNFTVTKSFFLYGNYAYMAIKGESGSSSAQSGHVGIGYTF